MTDTPVALDLLRNQVAALLSQIDTATLPPPDARHGTRDEHPGHEWRPEKGWTLRTVDSAEDAGFVFVDHSCDDIAYRWGVPGDWEALRIEDARRIGLAFLAAAAHADELFARVSRLDAFRRPTEPGDERPEQAPVRELKPGRRRGR